MAYTGTWGSSYYDYNGSTGSWSGAAQHSQQEQYNPVYPAYNGTSNFFSSSAQEYEPAPYRPTRPATENTTRTRIPTAQQRQRRNTDRLGKKTWPNRTFHLITINPDPSEQKPASARIAEPAPRTSIKVARGNNIKSHRGGSGIQKMPNFRFQGDSWETNGTPNRGGRGGGGGGGRGRGGSHRGGRYHGPPKPTNNKDDIKFVHLPDDAAAITFTVSSENIVAFHGFDSVFTTQHNFPVLIDKKIYTSCDHYYQICKVSDLTGVSSARLNKGVRDENGALLEEAPEEKEKLSFSALAKDILKTSSVSKEKVDEWRNTKGLAAVQKALYAKASQSAHMREALKESSNQILVHAYARDSIYGTGCNVMAIKKWLDDLEKTGVKTLKVPATFPLDETTVQHCPVFAQGRNILGVILMQLREKIRNDEIEVVDMSKIYTALRTQPSAASEPMDTTTKSSFVSEIKSIGTF